MTENKPDATAALAQSSDPGERGGPDGSAAGTPFCFGAAVQASVGARPYERQRGDPVYRPLKIFTLDPSVSLLDGAIATLKVPYERLEPGPRGAVFEVDNDDGFQRNQRVDLDDPAIIMNDGLEPTPSDPRFHQQMVYAVASSVYAAFRTALGRHITWSFQAPGSGTRSRLLLRPHALKDTRNAFYDRSTGSIQFGYLRASRAVSGRTLPGSWVFTCLSHDIVTHEVTHALLDGLRANFTIPTNPDVLAFHEAFGDLIAVFQHFSYADVLRKAIARARGDLQIAPMLTDLAAQFSHVQDGNSYGRALRSAVDERRRLQRAPADANGGEDGGRSRYREDLEPHALGAVLVAAVFEAFTTVYARKARRYIQLATGGSGVLPPGELPHLLVDALAEQASRLASEFLSVCIRAVDYCPPVDLYFGEYLRALITADHALVPDDPWGYREALIDAFRLRDIYPTDVPNLSEDALLWRSPDDRLPPCPELDFGALRFRGDPSMPASHDELTRQARALSSFIASGTRPRLFGLATRRDAAESGRRVSDPCIHSIRSTRRVGPQGQIVFDLVAEVTQRRFVDVGNGTTFPFYGGATVILDPEGQIRYVIRKNVGSAEREQRQREFLGSPAGARLWTQGASQAVPQAQMFKMLHDTP